MTLPVCYRVVVHGRVQGVWFRQSCRRLAADLDLTGWVRNRTDGTVEALFEGPVDAVARAVAWCRSGPPAAVVTDIEVTEAAPSGLDGFAVR